MKFLRELLSCAYFVSNSGAAARRALLPSAASYLIVCAQAKRSLCQLVYMLRYRYHSRSDLNPDVALGFDPGHVIDFASLQLMDPVLMPIYWNYSKKNAPPGGLEPPTFRLTAERASRLRHGGGDGPPPNHRPGQTGKWVT
ncbi:hypothetical protein EVAR_57128_1 [Eumeta japonica]|uniref:Uncharacterized protein n=1 Tax=Eumeta variegata TaxID=151549 RepID=A0A4C1YTQ7_EUMVA|nr:hypothetical protein EVAR_57128_1 [Eumeta japonica]